VAAAISERHKGPDRTGAARAGFMGIGGQARQASVTEGKLAREERTVANATGAGIEKVQEALGQLAPHGPEACTSQVDHRGTL